MAYKWKQPPPPINDDSRHRSQSNSRLFDRIYGQMHRGNKVWVTSDWVKKKEKERKTNTSLKRSF